MRYRINPIDPIMFMSQQDPKSSKNGSKEKSKYEINQGTKTNEEKSPSFNELFSEFLGKL